MSDGQLLLAALAAFTLLECARWVPARAWIFQAVGARAWRGSRPWTMLRTRGGGVAMLMPLPPVSPHLVTAAWPCAPHEEALCVWNDDSGVAQHVPWEQVQPRAEGAVLHVTPEVRTRCPNPMIAAAWVERIRAWMEQTSDQRRRSFLKHAEAMLDVRKLEQVAASLTRETRWLCRLGGWIFWWCFLGLPLAYWRFADTRPMFAVIAMLFAGMITQAVLLWRLVRRDARLKKEAAVHLLSVAFFPPSSMRAADWVCHVKSPEVHPLAALKAWGGEGEFRGAASRCWREARWPLGDFASRPWNGPEVEALVKFFKAHKVDPASLESAPAAQEGCTHWCPRCLVQYAAPATQCADCAGLPLQKFATDDAAVPQG